MDLLLILYSIRINDGKKLAVLTTRSDSLRSVLPAELHIAEQFSKTGRTNPGIISLEAIDHEILARTSSRHRGIGKLLWKQSEDASQMLFYQQMSHPKYQWLQTPPEQCQLELRGRMYMHFA